MAASFAQTGGDYLYNVVRVEIEELDPATMDVKAEAIKHVIDCDSEIGLDPEINEGKKTVLRDAKRILAQAKEEDLLEAINLKLTTVKFQAKVLPIIQGGTLRFDATDKDKVVGYDAPTMTEGVTNKKYFKLSAYIENYEGENVLNYVKFTFPKCRGKVIKLDFKKEFFAPEFDVRATENTKLKKSAYSFDYIDALPVI